MRYAAKILIMLLLIAVVLIPGCSVDTQSIPSPETIEIRYFHDTACGSCDGEEEFTALFHEVLADVRDRYPYHLKSYNVFTSEGEAGFNEEMEKWGIRNENVDFPAMMINGKLYSGMNNIESNLYEAYLAAGEEINTPLQSEEFAVYFYVTACGECLQVSEYLDSAESKLPDIKEYNVGEPEGLELVKEYFRAYNVPSDKQTVPIMFIGDTYLSGVNEIKKELPAQTAKGNGSATLDLTKDHSGKIGQKDTGMVDLSGYELLGIITAGLVNGLNPCSVSMLLFFLSVLSAQNMSVLKMGLAFVTGKLIAYILLGTVLYSVLGQFDIPWFQAATKVILLLFVLVITLLNIQDYFAARNENYSKIRLQLPVVLRKYNHQWIKKFTAAVNGKLLVLVCFGLGALITAGEFLCTGQIYLATIVYILQNSTAFNMQAAAYFIVYGLAFVAPLLLLTVLIHKGHEIFELSELFREKMHVIKLINTVVFLIFGIAVLILF